MLGLGELRQGLSENQMLEHQTHRTILQRVVLLYYLPINLGKGHVCSPIAMHFVNVTKLYLIR